MVVFSREFAILRMYRSATAEQMQVGVSWYAEARAYAVNLARAYHVTKQCAAGVIAALSPQLSWARNKEYAALMLQGKRDGIKPRTYCIAKNWDKAWRIACGAHPLTVLGGPKVRAFYRNICGKNDRSVTIDVWAKRVAEPFSDDRKFEESHYNVLAHAFQTVADALDIVPAHLQAICWVAARGTGA